MNLGDKTKCVVPQKIKCLNVACLIEEVVEVRARTLGSLLEWDLCSDCRGRKDWDACKGNLVPWAWWKQGNSPCNNLVFLLRKGLSTHKGVRLYVLILSLWGTFCWQLCLTFQCPYLPKSSVLFSSFSNTPAGGFIGLRHTVEGFCLNCLSLTHTESPVAEHLGLVTCLVRQQLEEYMRKLPCL